jgi:hypothetical protein
MLTDNILISDGFESNQDSPYVLAFINLVKARKPESSGLESFFHLIFNPSDVQSKPNISLLFATTNVMATSSRMTHDFAQQVLAKSNSGFIRHFSVINCRDGCLLGKGERTLSMATEARLWKSKPWRRSSGRTYLGNMEERLGKRDCVR